MFTREFIARPLTDKEKQNLLSDMFGNIIDEDNPNGRKPTIEDMKIVSCVTACRDIKTGQWRNI